ncbi:8237_t:CDS:2, partial [Paraglomus occultum]
MSPPYYVDTYKLSNEEQFSPRSKLHTTHRHANSKLPPYKQPLLGGVIE